MEFDEFGNPIMQPLVLPEEPGNLSIVQDMITSPEPTVGAEGMPEINIDTPPLDPAQAAQSPQPTEHDKLAAAQVILGTNGLPETVDQKIGKTTSATTQQVQSGASQAAANDLKQASLDSKAASKLESDSVAQQAEIESKISQEDNDVISRVETARALAQQENQVKFQQTMFDIDNKVKELANYKPETFWGSKSDADKVTSALSIGLGSFGQALLGSGQNVGMVLLQRKMDEFDKNQKLVYDGKLRQIEGMKGSLEMKRQLAHDAEKTFDAQKIAARAQIQSQNAKALAMAKTPQVQAAIAQRQAKMDADVAGKQAEIAVKYEAHTTTTTENDILKQVARNPGQTRDGKPRTEFQQKSALFYSQMKGAAQNLDKIDGGAVAARGTLQDMLRLKRSADSYHKTPLIGSLIEGVTNAAHMNPEDRLQRTDPEAYNYYTQIKPFLNGLKRVESGASLKPDEEASLLEQYFPSGSDSEQQVKQKDERRKEALKAMLESAG